MRSFLAALMHAILLGGIQLPIAAALAPEFGASIAYDKNDPTFQVAALRGKVALLVFFQSWCPICNGWSPELIKQLEATYANDHLVTLVGIKTDGDAAGAKQYLREHGGDPDKWLIASDAQGAYVTDVLGQDELWQYAVLDPSGSVVEKGNAGMFMNDGGAKKFALAVDRIDQRYGAKSVKVLSGTYSTALSRAVTLAEAGCLSESLASAMQTGKAEMKSLREELLAIAAKRVESAAAVVADSNAAVEDRFNAYVQLANLAKQFKGTEPGKAATKAAVDAGKDKALKTELTADAAWQQMRDKLAKIPVEQRKAGLSDAVPRFVKAYPGTVAAAQAQAALASAH